MGILFEPEYIHLGIMFCVIAGIILIGIIILVLHFVNEAKETKGMTKEEKKAFRAEQKASYEKKLWRKKEVSQYARTAINTMVTAIVKQIPFKSGSIMPLWMMDTLKLFI